MDNSGKREEVEKHDGRSDKLKLLPHKPEPANAQMVIKPFCECNSCIHWTKSADWNTSSNLEFENQHARKIYKDKKGQPLLTSTRNRERIPKITAYDFSKGKNLEKQSSAKVLIHGETIPQPMERVADSYFSEDIRLALEKLKYKYSLPLQSFAWPAIFRQMNIFMIGGPKSGKTMAYLPAVCTYCSEAEDKYSDFAKYKGPLVIIVCPNSRQCEEIYDLVKKLNIQSKIKLSIATYPLKYIQGTDILITIPEALIHCIQSRIVNFKRLCHLVFEDASNLLARNPNSIGEMLRTVNEMLEHRIHSPSVQLIVTSEKWTDDLKKLYKSIFVTPLVCFANPLESALYGNIHFEVKFLLTKEKINYLKETLENNFHVYKTVIICNNSEILAVNDWLNKNHITTIALTDKSTKDEIENCERDWSYTRGGLHKVLLCTDFIFDSLLYITDAVWLINYSFASSWTRFTKRFSAMASNYKSPWQSNEQDNVQCKSFLLIDETCEEQMGRILHLLNRLGKELPVNFQQYSDGFKYNSENEKIANKVQICENLKLFGKCSHPLCKNRHMLNEKVDVSEDLPNNGKIVFKIIQMKSAAHYVVQLIEYIDPEGCVHKINNDNLKRPLIYDNVPVKKIANEITLGKFYAVCEYTLNGDEYLLCHVVNVSTSNDAFVEVKLTTGIVMQTPKTRLYEIPSNLKIVEIYLSNVLPRFNDEYFSGRSVYVTTTSLESMDYKSIVLTADIDLQFDNTMWVNNVIQILKVEGTDIIKFDLIKYLNKDVQVVDISKDQLSSLRKLYQGCGIKLPVAVKQTTQKSVVRKEIKLQTAFFDQNINEVMITSAISPEEFYVRLLKYQSLLDNLEEEIKQALADPHLGKNLTPTIGKYYLAPDPSGKIYARALILNIENDKALCFYVDYGDEGVVKTSDLKMLSIQLSTKLPFQAIKCRLHGISPISKEWSDEATAVLYKYMFEPDSDIFRSLFVHVCDREKINGKESYSVLLKDGYGSNNNVLLNQIMLDCGFAKSLSQIDDFELPNQNKASQESDLDLDSYTEDTSMNEENLDLEIFNIEEFLEALGLSHLAKQRPQQQLTENTNETDNENYARITTASIVNPSETAEHNQSNAYLTPEIFWNQNENNVKMKINLVGVDKYIAVLNRKRFFHFSTNLDDKTYKVEFTLHKSAEIVKHAALGQEVQVVLKKVEPGEWMQLTATKKKFRFIHYEIIDEEEQKVKRKFLQLDITDEESDENDEQILGNEISDMDSEFDNDVASSSED